MYSIRFNKQATKFLAKQSKDIQDKILAQTEALTHNPMPNGVKKLQGNNSDMFRIRIGNYRVIYEINNNELIILVLKIGHRQDVYRGL